MSFPNILPTRSTCRFYIPCLNEPLVYHDRIIKNWKGTWGHVTHAVDLILQVNWRRQRSREMSEDKWMAIRKHSGRLSNKGAHKTQKPSRQGETGQELHRLPLDSPWVCPLVWGGGGVAAGGLLFFLKGTPWTLLSFCVKSPACQGSSPVGAVSFCFLPQWCFSLIMHVFP